LDKELESDHLEDLYRQMISCNKGLKRALRQSHTVWRSYILPKWLMKQEAISFRRITVGITTVYWRHY